MKTSGIHINLYKYKYILQIKVKEADDGGAPSTGWQLLLEMGEALKNVALRVLRLRMLPAFHLRRRADERLHAYLALKDDQKKK